MDPRRYSGDNARSSRRASTPNVSMNGTSKSLNDISFESVTSSKGVNSSNFQSKAQKLSPNELGDILYTTYVQNTFKRCLMGEARKRNEDDILAQLQFQRERSENAVEHCNRLEERLFLIRSITNLLKKRKLQEHLLKKITGEMANDQLNDVIRRLIVLLNSRDSCSIKLPSNLNETKILQAVLTTLDETLQNRNTTNNNSQLSIDLNPELVEGEAIEKKLNEAVSLCKAYFPECKKKLLEEMNDMIDIAMKKIY